MTKILPPFDRAAKYLAIKPRSVKEIYDYLKKKNYPEDEINITIKRLVNLKLLNDDDFARGFTEGKQRQGQSKRMIEFKMKLKGIKKDISNDVLKYSNSDLKTALSYIERRIGQFERFDKETRKKKIISRLYYRGFDWNIIAKVLKKIKI